MINSKKKIVLCSMVAAVIAVISIAVKLTPDFVPQTTATNEGVSRAIISIKSSRKLIDRHLIEGQPLKIKGARENVSNTSLRTVVLDPWRKPICDATTSLVNSKTGSICSKGATNVDGVFVHRAPFTSEVLTLVTEAEGFAIQTTVLPLPRPATIEIVMPELGSISGRVLLRSGIPPPAPVQVYAWQTDRYPETAELALSESGIPIIASAKVDELGYFALPCLVRGESYTVAAGGPGWISAEFVYDVHCPHENLNVELWRVFGCVIRAKHQDGSGATESPFGSLVWRNPGKAKVVGSGSVDSILAGITAVEGVETRNWTSTLFLFKAPEPNQALGPLKVRFTVAGYKPMVASISVPPVKDRIDEVSVVLEPDALGFGSLHINTGIDKVFEKNPLVIPLPARLELFPRTRTLGKGGLVIPIRSTSSFVARGVPFDTYDVRLISLNGMWAIPARVGDWSVVIGNEPATIDLPAEDFGSILLCSDGMNQGPQRIRIELTRVGTAISTNYTSRSLPLSLHWLPPGQYNLNIRPARNTESDSRQSVAKVDVVAGKISKSVFAWSK